MALIDEIQFHIKAGKGGDGVVRWLHEKGKEFSGPAGGNGGKGGDVYVRGISDIGALARYRNKKEFESENGQDGMKNSQQGKNGDDLYIDFPIGSIVKNLETGEKFSLDKVDQTELILKGGRGGVGNEFFKSSINTSPTESTSGVAGEEADFLVELEMIADCGLVGLPNAGKSSLLNALTAAHAKVGSYQFTTLEPNLGEMYGFIIADIPGLIEGASEGRGLGDKFLKHIRRTRLIVHMVSAENEDLVGTYKTVQKELTNFDIELGEKKEIIVLSKIDEIDFDEIKPKMEELMTLGKDVFALSTLDDKSLKSFKDNLVKILREVKS